MADQEKTEKGTPKKREEARQRGHVAKSREVPSVIVLFALLILLILWGPSLGSSMMEIAQSFFDKASLLNIEDEERARSLLFHLGIKFSHLVLPIFGVAILAGILGNYIQVGFLFSLKPISPSLSNIDPINGINRLFSIKSLAELLKGIIKILIVGYVAFSILKGEIPMLIEMVNIDDVKEIFSNIYTSAMKIGLKTTFVFLFLALMDYAFQKWQYEKNLRMTRHELQDEFKQREGDPLIRARIRSIQREMAKRRMMSAVPKADVVITNPQELAVAMEYVKNRMNAPKVTAKGSGHLAARIKEIARKNNVPVVENKALTQILYRDVEIGEEIPANLYHAVAEVLAYVYRLKGRTQI
jgi:flagellar biosynthetic protein FlhB